MTSHDLGLIPGLSRPEKCNFQFPVLSRICMNLVTVSYLEREMLAGTDNPSKKVNNEHRSLH